MGTAIALTCAVSTAQESNGTPLPARVTVPLTTAASVTQEVGGVGPIAHQPVPVGQLVGTMFVGASDFDPAGVETEAAALGLGLDLSGRISERTRLSLSFVRGPVDIVSALTLPGLFRPTVRAMLQHPNWNLTVGDLNSANHALAGPTVRADGFALGVRKRLVAEIAVGRPKYLGGGSGGHV